MQAYLSPSLPWYFAERGSGAHYGSFKSHTLVWYKPNYTPTAGQEKGWCRVVAIDRCGWRFNDHSWAEFLFGESKMNIIKGVSVAGQLFKMFREPVHQSGEKEEGVCHFSGNYYYDQLSGFNRQAYAKNMKEDEEFVPDRVADCLDSRVFLDDFPVGYFILDQCGKILNVNRAGANLLGKEKGSMVGQRFKNFLDQEGQAVFQQFCQEVGTSPSPMGCEIVIYRKDNGRSHVQLTCSKIGGDDSFPGEMQPFAWQMVMTDISWRKEQERLLLLAKEAAESADQAKSLLLGSVSHEIRNLMNVVMGMSEILVDAGLPPEQQRYAEMMHHSSEAALTLLNDVLDISKLESGRLTLLDEPFSPALVVEESIGMLKIAAQQKGLSLRSTIAATTPDPIQGDASRLRQVLLNLIGNAIKFTERGEIELCVKPHPIERGMMLFSVTDSGIGLAPQDQERIFDRFVQVTGATDRPRGSGIGLGLDISRKLVEGMGGRIGVQSKPGQGSTFFFTLPMRLGELPAVPVQPVNLPREVDNRSLRILLVEDSRDAQELFQVYLNGTLHQVVTVDDGAKAVARVREERFDLVLMDLQLPVLDGYAATRRIRFWERKQRCSPLFILALSAHTTADRRKESLAAGCNGHLNKPIKKLEFLKAIQQVGRLLDSGGSEAFSTSSMQENHLFQNMSMVFDKTQKGCAND
ncbi:MAG: response regulator [Magnetococcales bacterium]|nr:response regulator [Magnetococcales bacterium]